MSCSKAESDQNKILFEFRRGDDRCFRVAVVNTSDEKPFDITGWTLTTTLKLSPTGADTGKNAMQVINPRLRGEDAVKGICFVELKGSETKNLLPAPYFFDVQVSLDGKVITALTGRLRVLPDITRKS